jgi:hypothetical protein
MNLTVEIPDDLASRLTAVGAAIYRVARAGRHYQSVNNPVGAGPVGIHVGLRFQEACIWAFG